MGNTCASVHVALTGTPPDAIDGIVRAYKTLGFERTETAPDGGNAPIVNTAHVFNWVLNHADCYTYLATSIEDMKDRIDQFAAHHPVVQAWHSQSTWQPLFDHADDYHRTVYEEKKA